MNKTVKIYGTNNPVVVVRKIVEGRASLSAPSRDFRRASARAERYGNEEAEELRCQPRFQELVKQEDKLIKTWIRNNDVRKFSPETDTQQNLKRELEETRKEMYDKFCIPRDRKVVLLAQFIAQSYLRRNRKDFR